MLWTVPTKYPVPCDTAGIEEYCPYWEIADGVELGMKAFEEYGVKYCPWTVAKYANEIKTIMARNSFEVFIIQSP